MKTALCCVLLLLAPPALADGTIIGTVVDYESRRPFAGAVVTATSPHLQGEQTVVMDELGDYRLAQLPVGVYTLRIDWAGTSISRSDISVRLHRTVRINARMHFYPCLSATEHEYWDWAG
jgi:hypothetical protein